MDTTEWLKLSFFFFLKVLSVCKKQEMECHDLQGLLQLLSESTLSDLHYLDSVIVELCEPRPHCPLSRKRVYIVPEGNQGVLRKGRSRGMVLPLGQSNQHPRPVFSQ